MSGHDPWSDQPEPCVYEPPCYLEVCRADGCQIACGNQDPGPDLHLADLDFVPLCENPACRFDEAPAAHLVTTRQPCGHNDELLACRWCVVAVTCFADVGEFTCQDCGLSYVAQTRDLFTVHPIPVGSRSHP